MALRRGATVQCVHCARNARRAAEAGDEFNDWTVMCPGPSGYYCRCKCGREKLVATEHLTQGNSTRCPRCAAKALTKGAWRAFWTSIVSNAKRRDIVFELTEKEAHDLLEEQGWVCKLSGSELLIAETISQHKHGATASLDRIDSTKPYAIGNVQWVHKDINRLKNKYGQAEFIAWCVAVARHSGGFGTDSNQCPPLDGSELIVG